MRFEQRERERELEHEKKHAMELGKEKALENIIVTLNNSKKRIFY